MNPKNYPLPMRELMAKNILLSWGGNIYPMPHKISFDVKDASGTSKSRSVKSIHFTPGWKNEYYFYVEGLNGFCTAENEQEKEKIYDFILESFKYPDMMLMEKDELIDRLNLRAMNISFISQHGDLDEGDFAMIEEYRSLVAKAHDFAGKKPVPLPGDIVEGAYYGGKYPFSHGVIESDEGWKNPISVCAQPYTPWIHARGENSYAITTSGGPFFSFNIEDFEYVGEDTRMLCDWGHCGGCANGTVSFNVKVNRWKVKKEVDY